MLGHVPPEGVDEDVHVRQDHLKPRLRRSMSFDDPSISWMACVVADVDAWVEAAGGRADAWQADALRGCGLDVLFFHNEPQAVLHEGGQGAAFRGGLAASLVEKVGGQTDGGALKTPRYTVGGSGGRVYRGSVVVHTLGRRSVHHCGEHARSDANESFGI